MRILMRVDGSPCSKSAVAFVAARAALMKRRPKVELLNVQYRVPVRVSRTLGKEMVDSYHQSEADKVLKPALASLQRADLTATARHVVGTVADELVAIVAAEGPDLIVMGSHGHTGLKKLLFGSVANTVLASCSTPVLVLRGKPLPKTDALKVGIAVDGSPYALAVVRFVVKHRHLFGEAPQVTLMHVAPDLAKLGVPALFGRGQALSLKPEQVAAMQAASFENALAPARKLLQRAGIETTEVRLSGNNPGDCIAEQARKGKLQLLALGSHGQGEFTSTLLGSVATRVAAQCQLPLLLVRQK